MAAEINNNQDSLDRQPVYIDKGSGWNDCRHSRSGVTLPYAHGQALLYSLRGNKLASVCDPDPQDTHATEAVHAQLVAVRRTVL